MLEEFQRLEEDKYFTAGFKAYYPLSASPAMNQLIGLGPKALSKILEAMEGSHDQQYRRALLFIIAHIDDPLAEDVLISALLDDDLNGLSAFLLGNYHYRSGSGEYNKPDKFIRNKEKVLSALFPLLKDRREYKISADRFEVRPAIGDLVIASFIRIGGLKNFDIDQKKYRWIGLEIPDFTEEDRNELLNGIEKFCSRY